MPRLSAKAVEDRENFVKELLKLNGPMSAHKVQDEIVKKYGMKMTPTRLQEVIKEFFATPQPAKVEGGKPVEAVSAESKAVATVAIPLIGNDVVVPAEKPKPEKVAPKPPPVYEDPETFGVKDFKINRDGKITIADIPSGLDPAKAWARMSELGLVEDSDY